MRLVVAVFFFAGFLGGISAQEPQEPSRDNDGPAVKFKDKGYSSVVYRSGSLDRHILRFYVVDYLGLRCRYGFLNVSSEKLWWQPECPNSPLEVPRTAIGTIKKSHGRVEIEFAGKKRSYVCEEEKDTSDVSSVPCVDFLEKALRDFAAADADFSRMHGDKPKTPAIDDDFRAKAATWRALTTKPLLPDEVHSQRVLAEAALQEKDFKSAIDHYETGVTAQALWPEGWFNLALLYAEIGDYGYAVDRMKHYLELSPDAVDANAARDKMIIWEEKAAKQSGLPLPIPKPSHSTRR